jgi:transcriptional regulator with XRE-family HTH domain
MNDQAERFRGARTAAGLTQRGLAARIGYSFSVVARIESGARQPNIAQATAIADALDAPYLLEGVPDAEAAERLRRARISAGNRGKTRPDASERMTRLHAELRLQADRARGDLLDVDELAKARGIGRSTVVARVCVGKLRAVPIAGAVTLSGRRRLFFARDVDWHARGSHPASLRALFSTHVGPIRQKALGRWFGRQYGYLGGPKRRYTDEQAENVRKLKREHPGWGRSSLTAASGLTEKQVRAILK